MITQGQGLARGTSEGVSDNTGLRPCAPDRSSEGVSDNTGPMPCTRDVGGFAKLVRGFCRCSSVPEATCHFSRKFVAHRVSPNFSISGIILHRCSVIYFLTDL